MIRRHSATAIFMHWYNAACWLLLLFTGFALLANPLMQPVGDWWSSLWTGAFGALGCSGARRRGHGVDRPVCRLPARPGAGGGLPFLKEITDLHIGSDLVWCLRKGLWLVLGERAPCARLGLDPELPPQGFYNAGQKLVAIIAVLCSLGLALTGLILVFASGRPGDGGAPADLPARAFLLRRADGCFPAVHIYMAAFAPGEARRCGPCSPDTCRWSTSGTTTRCGSASWRNRKRNRARFF